MKYAASRIVYLDPRVVSERVRINVNAEQRVLAVLQLLHELDEARVLLFLLP